MLTSLHTRQIDAHQIDSLASSLEHMSSVSDEAPHGVNQPVISTFLAHESRNIDDEDEDKLEIDDSADQRPLEATAKAESTADKSPSHSSRSSDSGDDALDDTTPPNESTTPSDLPKPPGLAEATRVLAKIEAEYGAGFDQDRFLMQPMTSIRKFCFEHGITAAELDSLTHTRRSLQNRIYQSSSRNKLKSQAATYKEVRFSHRMTCVIPLTHHYSPSQKYLSAEDQIRRLTSEVARLQEQLHATATSAQAAMNENARLSTSLLQYQMLFQQQFQGELQARTQAFLAQQTRA